MWVTLCWVCDAPSAKPPQIYICNQPVIRIYQPKSISKTNKVQSHHFKFWRVGRDPYTRATNKGALSTLGEVHLIAFDFNIRETDLLINKYKNSSWDFLCDGECFYVK